MSNKNKSSVRNPENRRDQDRGARHGIYLGEVVSSKDVSRTGRLRVFVAAFGKDKSKTHGYFDCIWVSPFAGSTNYADVSPDDTTSYEGTQKSYGMWMVPPDIGNIVLVAFGDGNSKYPLAMGCLFPDQYNHMVPGIPAGEGYQGVGLPVAEKNRFDANTENGPGAARPVHHDFAEALTKQGLINDPLRGPTTSGAKREAPSEVFGILTPGAKDPVTNQRTTGHQFIMDDNTDNKQIRIRSAGGAQVLMDDTTGTVYVINSPGTAWVELTPEGAVNVYAQGDTNIRSEGNFNLRADKNVNIEAGGNLNLKASGDMSGGKYVGLPTKGDAPKGIGGNIHFESTGDMTQAIGQNLKTTAYGGGVDFGSKGKMSLTSYSDDIEASSPRGAIKMDSKDNTSISADNFVATTSQNTVLQSNKILLNSGGPSAPSNRPAVEASQISTNDFLDQAKSIPSYDREAEIALTEGGLRTGDRASMKTIVEEMLTAEPYDGHLPEDQEGG